MFTAAALVPSTPLLVPELGGADLSASEELRTAAVKAAAQLAGAADAWTVLGVGHDDRIVAPDAVGTFAGFGVDVRVSLSPEVSGVPDRDLPLPALIGGWLRDQVAATTSATVRIVAADASPIACAEIGTQLRRELDAESRRHGVLVVADGATTLTPKAPGSYDPASLDFQTELDAALADADRAAIAQLDPVVCAEFGADGRAAWQVLAALFDHRPVSSTLYSAAPFGVGYFVGTWRRDR